MILVTIGAHGFDEQGFFDALQRANVDTFCDLRLRRGMRGRAYAFANRLRLEHRLKELGIRYLHLQELAPSQALRDQQKDEDSIRGETKTTRTELSLSFVEAYRSLIISQYHARDFLMAVGPHASVVALFCVERSPRACHRSIVADHLARELVTTVEDLMPCKS